MKPIQEIVLCEGADVVKNSPRGRLAGMPLKQQSPLQKISPHCCGLDSFVWPKLIPLQHFLEGTEHTEVTQWLVQTVLKMVQQLPLHGAQQSWTVLQHGDGWCCKWWHPREKTSMPTYDGSTNVSEGCHNAAVLFTPCVHNQLRSLVVLQVGSIWTTLI
jgi:hypothetical protein